MNGPTLSVSQLNAFDHDADGGCEARWAGTYSPGGPKLREPGTSSTTLGSRVHKVAEDWQEGKAEPNPAEALTLPDRNGAPVTYYPGKIFLAGKHLNPAQGSFKVEGKTYFKTNLLGRPINWVVIKDLEGRDTEGLWGKPGLLWIKDHKTAKDWKYQKTAKKLIKDPQANMYAIEAMQRTGEPVVGVRWITYNTTADENGEYEPARASQIELIDVQVKDVVAAIEKKAHRLLDMYDAKIKPQDANYNEKSCRAFGKTCMFKGTQHCPLTKSQSFNSFFGESTMANDSELFMNFVNTKFAPVGAPPPPPPPVPIVNPSANGPTIGINPPPPPPPALKTYDNLYTPEGLVSGTVVETVDEKGNVYRSRPLTEESTDNRTFEFLAQTVGAKAAERIIGQVKAESVLPPPPAPPATFNMGAVQKDLSGLGAQNAAANQQAMYTQFAQQGRPMVGGIGVVNSPEAPLYAPASPEEAAVMTPVVDTSEKAAPDVLDTMDRTALKALNIRLGLCTESSRFQEPKLRANVREYAQTHGVPIASVLDLHNRPLKVGVQDVDTSTPSVDVLSDMLSVLGEQLEANRSIAIADTNIGLSMEEREAVQAASQSISSGQTFSEDMLVEARLTLKESLLRETRVMIREELERFFAERFGR